MLKPIKLKRKADAPTFKDERGGEYKNPIIEVRRIKDHDFDIEISLVFGLYEKAESIHPSLKLEKCFDGRSVEVATNEETGQVIEWGYPNYNYTIDNLLEFDAKGVPLLKSVEGIAWLTNTPYLNFPNSLGETNLSNWEFINDDYEIN